MTKYDYELFQQICRLKQSRLLRFLNKFILQFKYRPIRTNDYLFAEGKLPVLLIAHVDTVFKAPPINIYYDKEKSIIWSPEGLGADDRAGVFAIIKILQTGLRPSILFTTNEEIGGLGAEAFLDNYSEAPTNLKYLIQLDRQGSMDCVFYNCDNPEFTRYIESFGFKMEYGSFTDISHICPIWKIAGVNLSIGYKNEHSVSETLHTISLEATINKTIKLLEDSERAPYFKYIPMSFDNEFCVYPFHYFISCNYCHKLKTSDSLFPVLQHDGSVKFMCIDCIDVAGDNIAWCANCGNAFTPTNLDDIYCVKCKEILNDT